MRNSKSYAAVALTLLGVGIIPTAGCGTSPDATIAKAAETKPATTRVTTIKPERATIRRTTSEPGQIEAYEVAAIYAKLGGYVRKVSVDIGEKVKKGQVLVDLRVPETDADLKQKRAMIDQAEAERKQSEAAVEVARAGILSAEAKVAEIKAGIRRAEADVARWQSEFTRVQQLAKEGALTGSLLDETRSKLGAAQASRDEVLAKVKSSEASLAEALAFLDKSRSDVIAAVAHVAVARFEAERAEAIDSYTKIESPFDGIVTRRHVDTGQLTTPGATGEPLLVVSRSDLVTITVGVPETDAPFVNAGDPVQVRLQAYGGRSFDGKVTRTGWALDASTRTLRTEIDLPNVDDFLRPGLYAYATIITEEHKNTLTLPTTAVVKEGDKSLCVIVSNGRATRKEIKVGLTEGKRSEILSGLKGDEEVVAANSASLTEGQSVEGIKPEGEGTKPKS